MTTKPLIDRDVVGPILDCLNRSGGDTDRLLETSGLMQSWLDPTETSFPEYNLWSLFDLAGQSLDMPSIGLLTGESICIGDFGTFGKRLEQSLTLFRCLQEYCSQVNQVSSHARFWLEESSDGFWFCRRGIDLIDVGRDYVEQFTMQLMVRLVQLATGPGWTPNRICLQNNSPRYFYEFDGFESAEIECSRSATAIWVPRKQILSSVRRDFDIPCLGKMRKQLLECRDRNLPDLSEFSEIQRTSRRSVQRLLSANGLDWSRLLDQVRLQLAIDSLHSTDVRLIDLADQLGYSDPANFGRAFRRWTGCSPHAFRRMHRAN